jgi:hypothetical protein
MLPPPSTRARLPAPVCANTAILLALMVMVSLPAPALNLNDVLDASTSTNILKVLGNNGDSVNASGIAKIISAYPVFQMLNRIMIIVPKLQT